MPRIHHDCPVEVHANPKQPLGMPPAQFLRDYWQKRPLLIRGAFPSFKPPLSPDELAGLACMEGALARIVLRETPPKPSFRNRCRAQPATGSGTHLAVSSSAKMDYSPHPATHPAGAIGFADVRSGILPPQSGLRRDDVKRKGIPVSGNDGKWSVSTGPFDDDVFAKLPESHWTLLVQDVDKWDADTAALLDTLDFIPSWRIDDVMVSYATDQGGVGAHVDQYDVFLLQGLGQRRWLIDARPNPPTAFRDDVELKLLKDFSPSHTWTLDPGDMLYLPPGVPHDGMAVGECTTFSIGMRAPSEAEMLTDLAHTIANRLPEDQRYTDADLAPATVSGEIDAAALQRVRRSLGAFAQALDDDALADWFGCFITRYRSALVPAPRKRPIDTDSLAKRLEHGKVIRDTWSRFAWRRHGRGAVLYASGEAFPTPLAWAKALAGHERVLEGATLSRLPRQTQGIRLLKMLIDAGHIGLRVR